MLPLSLCVCVLRGCCACADTPPCLTPARHPHCPPQAMMTLFIASSGEGWPGVMYRAMDVTGVERSGQRDASPASALYFVVFIAVGAFFFQNLFVGVMFDRFMFLSRRLPGFGLMTEQQRRWVQGQNQLSSARAWQPVVPPDAPWRQWFFRFIHKEVFDAFIMTIIMLSVGSQAVVYEVSLAGVRVCGCVPVCWCACVPVFVAVLLWCCGSVAVAVAVAVVARVGLRVYVC